MFFNYPGLNAWKVLTRYCTFRQVRDINGPHTCDKWGNDCIMQRQQKVFNRCPLYQYGFPDLLHFLQGFRPVQFSSSGPVPASPTKVASYGVHYGPPQARNEPMINRVQQSLENVTIGGQDQEDYDYVPVSQRKAVFQQHGTVPLCIIYQSVDSNMS